MVPKVGVEPTRPLAAQGIIDEKRSFVRMFVRRVVLDPATGKGRLELYRIPRIQALPPAGDNA